MQELCSVPCAKDSLQFLILALIELGDFDAYSSTGKNRFLA